MLRFERDLVETKDILKTFMLKYDGFVNDTNGKLEDYEAAIAEIEKGMQVAIPEETTETVTDDQDAVLQAESDESESEENVEQTVTSDLKSILKKEVSINV
jgi:hypothetical protein